MRLALQALCMNVGDGESERSRREKMERELRNNERSAAFFWKLRAAVADKELGAPEIFADESFPDANIVAEYIDGQQISKNLAREYEDACWNASELLAEIGSCYEILNERGEFASKLPKNCRRRLYYIAWEEAAGSHDAVMRQNSETKTIKKNEVQKTPSIFFENESNSNNESDSKKIETRNDLFNVAAPSLIAATSTNESEIQLTLQKERNARKKIRRWFWGTTTALILCSVVYVNWEDREVSVKNLQKTEASGTELVLANSGENSDSNQFSSLTPLRPTTISSSNLDEFEAISPDEFEAATGRRVVQNADETNAPFGVVETDGSFVNTEFGGANFSDVSELTRPSEEELPELVESKPAFVALTPSMRMSKSQKLGTTYSALSSTQDDSAGTKRRLFEGSNYERRPGFVIPEKNNDVFSRSLRY